MFVSGNGFVVWALQTAHPHNVAVLVAMIPVYTVVLAALMGRQGHRASPWLGLIAGVVGVALLSATPDVLNPAAATAHFSTLLRPHCMLEAALGVQVGCISWALGSICATRVDRRLPASAVAGAQMLAGGLVLLLMAAATGRLWTAGPLTVDVVAALATATLVGSVLAFVCYTIAIRHLPITTVALHAYLSPVVAIAISSVLHPGTLSLSSIGAMAIVFVGVALAAGRHESE
jgi:drug/metabolite transporter (DMT)-like permease